MLLIVTAVAVVLLPGWLVARSVGLRGLVALAGAPPLTYGLTAVAGPAANGLGVRWGVLPLAAVTVLGCAVGGAVGRRGRGPQEDDRSGERAIGLGVLTGAALGAVTVLRGAGGLGGVHQGWDAAFHANAIQLVLDTGRADPASPGLLSVGQTADYYYPNALHVLSAVVGQASGATVPSLLTVQMMLLPGIAGLGLAVLVRRCGAPVAVAAVCPLVLASFGAVTYDLYTRGPLLPYATGLALTPGLLLLFERTLGVRRPGLVLAAGLGAAGLLAVHPGAAVSAAVFGTLLVAQRAWRSPRDLPVDLTNVAAVGAVAVVCGLPYLAGLLATGEAGASVDWPAWDSALTALRNLALLDPAGRTPRWVLLALVLVGLLGLGRLRALWWWLGAGALAALGFFAVSVSDAAAVEALSQPWWNDRWRFMALVALAVVPLAAAGLVSVAEVLTRLLRRGDRPEPHRERVAAVSVLVVLALVGAFSGTFYADVNRAEVARSYRQGPTVSDEERAAMAELGALSRSAGATGRVMNDPGDGSAWMYALEGTRPVFGFTVDTDNPAVLPLDQQLLMESFRCLDSDPQIRGLVQRYDIAFVYLGPGFLRERFSRLPGLRRLQDVRSLEQVYASPGTAIYRVTMTTRPLAPVPGSSCASATEVPDAG